MTRADLLRFSLGAVLAHRLRSALTVLGIVIGIASVILLTSLGEGTRSSILAEFTQFGTNLLQVTPGHLSTSGGPGALGGTLRKLTLDDAEALLRIPGIERVVPVQFGTARVSAGDRSRSIFVYGVTSDVPEVWKFRVAAGSFLPPGDPRRDSAVVVLGPKLKRELLGDGNALGERVRIGGRRYLVVGVLESKGLLLGFDLDDAAYIPVAAARDLFDRDALVEIDVLFDPRMRESDLRERIRTLLVERHDGEEDFTIQTQTEMLDVLGRVLSVINAAVGGIGGISLVVGALGILTMMWISVGERTAEIGLVRALGATREQVEAIFLVEAVLLSTTGGLLGLATGLGLAAGLRLVVPSLPMEIPTIYVLLSLGVSFAIGIASGVLPARRAATLDPIEALRAE